MTTENVVKINGLAIPTCLTTLTLSDKSGQSYWLPREKMKVWRSMFSAGEMDLPQIYPMNLLIRTNAEWTVEERELFLGKNDGLASPGYLDARISILIGELGQDALLALDFSESSTSPGVSYLKWYAPRVTRWTRVTNDLQSFLRNLGLAPPP